MPHRNAFAAIANAVNELPLPIAEEVLPHILVL
jgi:hypothetical protein